jgi:hypothetical protein
MRTFSQPTPVQSTPFPNTPNYKELADATFPEDMINNMYTFPLSQPIIIPAFIVLLIFDAKDTS